MVGGFPGMLLLSAKHSRSFVCWEDTTRQAVRIPFNGPVIPFGAMVEYHPISAKDISRRHHFGPKVLPGFFLGYVLYAGGIWKGDTMVADIEQLEKMDASEIHAKRLNAKEVLTPMKDDIFLFPVADGTIKIPGGDPRLRTSTLIRDRPERGEEQEVLRGESDGLSSPTPLQDDSTRDDAEAKNDFLVHFRKLHILPSRGTKSQTVRAERIISYSTEIHWRLQNYKNKFGCYPRTPHRWLLEYRWVKRFVWFLDRFHSVSFPIPMKYIDITRTTHTSLDVLSEKQIGDYRNVDGERELSDAWTGFTRFI